MIDQTQAPKANGLSTVINTIVSPNEAFQAIRTAPTWAWAFIVCAVVYLVGYALLLPASNHAALGLIQHMIATNPAIAGMSDERKAKMLSDATNPSVVKECTNALLGLVGIFIAALLNTLFMLLANVIGKGDASFKKLWSGSMNVLVPSFALGELVAGIIAAIRGPESYGTVTEILRSVPGLGLLAGNMSGFGAGFLAALSVFALWGLVLNALMVRTVGRVPAAVAWTFAIVITLLQSAFIGLGAMFTG